MRCAIFAVTGTGLRLARRARSLLADEGADIYGKEGTAAADENPLPADSEEGIHTFHRLRDAVEENFSRYDALVFIMAAGIAVRMIAPLVRDKLKDPAVVVMDERGENVVSLLSGHMGGANLLASRLAEGLGGRAVITTATDVEGMLAPDAIAMRLALRPWPRDEIKTLNGGLLDGVPVSYYVDADLPSRVFFQEQLCSWGIAASIISGGQLPETGLRVFLTASAPSRSPGLLCLAPRRLIAGVGCRRGTERDAILESIRLAVGSIHRSIADISLIASTAVKADEPGILEAARELGIEARFFENNALKRAIERYGLEKSEFVRETIGIGNVCEAAALASVERGTIALPKRAYDKTTVALVWER